MRRTRCRLGARTSTNGISPRHARLSSRTSTPGGTVVPPPAETFFMLLEPGDFMLQEGDDKMLTESAP
jgi:hypothetical protein